MSLDKSLSLSGHQYSTNARSVVVSGRQKEEGMKGGSKRQKLKLQKLNI